MPQTIELDRASLPPPGGLVQVEAGGETVLLSHDADGFHAVGGTCPHAGAPLIEGVRHGRRIVCPWHKAAFCLRSGTLLDPPAVDPLPAWRVELEGADGPARLVRIETPDADPAPDARRFAIVGAGAAGAMAAQTLREEGFGGRIEMLDAENRVPYDRTLLSKYRLSGEEGGEKSPLQPAGFYERHRIERVQAVVTGLDPDARRLSCADGSAVEYDAVLLAPGSRAAPASLPGGELDGVFTLRGPADADAILAWAGRSRRCSPPGSTSGTASSGFRRW